MLRVDEAGIADLPRPVQRNLRHCGVLDSVIPSSVVVRQEGRIRSAPDARWLRFRAVEEYQLDPPGFEWNAALRIAGLTLGRARDSLADGRGHMKVRLLGAFTVVDQASPEIDQGTILRWLNETMWFPAIWATDTISWEPIDDSSAVASISVGDLSTRAEFVFDDEGRLVDCRADRYRMNGSDAFLTPWSTPLDDYARFEGLELPSSGSAVWALPDGEFEYIQIRVTDIRYST